MAGFDVVFFVKNAHCNLKMSPRPPIEDVGKSQSTPAATCADGFYVAYGCMMRFWLHYVRFFFSSRKFTSAPKRRAGSHLPFGQPKLSQVQLATVFMDGEEFACK